MSCLQPATQARYEQALVTFSSELAARGLSLLDMAEDDLDWTLAEKVVDLYEETFSGVCLGAAATLVAAVAKIQPRFHLRCSFRALDVWRTRHPPHQAVAFPRDVALAIVTWCLFANQPAVAAVVLLCWSALLRASEALALCFRSFVRIPTGFVVILGRSKRGIEQKIDIQEPSIVLWFEYYLRHCGLKKPSERMMPISYTKLQNWLRKAAAWLGFGHIHWTTHGLRRGAASHLSLMGVSFGDIMLRGRWLGERSAREYIRRGEASLLKAREDTSDAAWALSAKLAAIGPTAWRYNLALDQLPTER